MLKMDGFDGAVVGIINQWDGKPVIAYSEAKILDELSKQMSRDDALEYYHYNIRGAYVGPNTPVIIEEMTMDEIDNLADELD